MKIERYEVDKKLMEKGLEEALKYQLNLINEAVRDTLVNQFSGRCEDFETIRRKLQAMGFGTMPYTEKYDLLCADYNSKRIEKSGEIKLKCKEKNEIRI